MIVLYNYLKEVQEHVLKQYSDEIKSRIKKHLIDNHIFFNDIEIKEIGLSNIRFVITENIGKSIYYNVEDIPNCQALECTAEYCINNDVIVHRSYNINFLFLMKEQEIIKLINKSEE